MQPIMSKNFIRNNYFISGISALLLHVVILFLMLINIHFLLNQHYGKTNSIANVSVYFYHDNDKKNMTAKQQNTDSKIKVLSKIKNENFSKKNIDYSSVTNAANIAGNNEMKLLEILHDAIRQQQQYPQAALLLKQQGVVQIAFRLFPDGHLENLRIAHSCGINDLDQSALAAVAAINPVKIAGSYLHAPKDFYIDLVYRSKRV